MKHLSFIILVFLAAVQIHGQSANTFTADEIREDLAVVKKVIFEVHPRPFQWHPKDSFELWFTEAVSNVREDMSIQEFKDLLYPIYQKLGCGHSRIQTTKSLEIKEKKEYKRGEEKHLLPILATAIEDTLIVRSYLNKDSLLHRGDQIISINDISMTELIKKVENAVTSDGYNTTHYRKSFNKNFRTYYHRFYPYEENYSIEIIDSLGKKRIVSVPAQIKSKATKKKYKKESKNPSPLVSVHKNDLTTIFRKGNYKFSRSKIDSSLAIIRIPKFSGRQGIRFYKKVFKNISEDPSIENVAIDIRNNGGGDAGESFFLLRVLSKRTNDLEISRRKHYDKEIVKNLSTNSLGLWMGKFFIRGQGEKTETEDYYKVNIALEPHKRIRYDGPLYVLIDGYSFSASCVVSSFLKANERAIFIGEETGGGIISTNAMQTPQVILPNTSLRIRSPLWALDQQIDVPNEGRGIFPDYPTQWTVEDVVDKKDPDLELLYDLLKDK